MHLCFNIPPREYWNFGDASVNAKEAVIVSVQKKPGESTIDLTKEIMKAIEEIKPSLPAEAAINHNLFKQAVFIQTSIQNV